MKGYKARQTKVYNRKLLGKGRENHGRKGRIKGKKEGRVEELRNIVLGKEKMKK